MTCCLIDYGSGNVHSARKALSHVAEGREVRLSADPDFIVSADHAVLPGVGAFGSCMARLLATDGVVEAIRTRVRSGKPLLGICVGMQLLADTGEEHGEAEGLGLIAGRVRKLDTGGLPSPHMGWNTVRAAQGGHPVLPDDADAYFVHSYAFSPDDRAVVVAEADYPEPFPAMIARDNVLGTQFHPEKSQAYGLALLGNFLKWSP